MRVAITGSSGLIGTAVREECARRGWPVTRIVRGGGAPAPGVVVWDIERGVLDPAGLEGHDIVIHLAGAPIAGVWTPARKRRVMESRVRSTELLATTLARLTHKPRLFISMSAAGYYGNRDPTETLTEESPPGRGYLAEVAVRWEAAARPAAEAGIRLVHPRMGNVLSRQGGFLGALKPVFRLGLGASFGSGAQIWTWIAMDDVLGALLHVIENESLRGPVNFVAPEATTNLELTRALAEALHRPAFLRVPAWAARLAPGNMGEEILLAGARVVPQRLLESGYVFRWPSLRPALAALVGRAA